MIALSNQEIIDMVIELDKLRAEKEEYRKALWELWEIANRFAHKLDDHGILADPPAKGGKGEK